MRIALHTILFILLCLVSTISVEAKGFSYVYIQGDKEVPFYVKFEDQMLPRYGKNYNIIPQLAPGPINIQILFQQNIFPPQRFTIMVPENGFRGFLLLKKGDAFTLYDIQQQFYLQPGNKPEDDHAPAANTADAFVYKTPPVTNTSTPTSIARNTQPVSGQNDGAPRFMSNIELNNERTVRNSPAQPVQEEEPVYEEEITYGNNTTGNIPETNTRPVEPGKMVANSDCPNAINNEDFEDLYKKVQDKNEKVKLKYLLSKMDDCYTATQVRILTEALNNDPEKYTFLKRVYPRVTDQYNFPPHENLLSTEEWKSYFRLILPK